MKTTILLSIVLLSFSCTTFKNGYNDGYVLITKQRYILVSQEPVKKLNKYHYVGLTQPSLMTAEWPEWEYKYKKGDTIRITRSQYMKTKFHINN